jgi:hypothetical protein
MEKFGLNLKRFDINIKNSEMNWNIFVPCLFDPNLRYRNVPAFVLILLLLLVSYISRMQRHVIFPSNVCFLFTVNMSAYLNSAKELFWQKSILDTKAVWITLFTVQKTPLNGAKEHFLHWKELRSHCDSCYFYSIWNFFSVRRSVILTVQRCVVNEDKPVLISLKIKAGG